jgi:hypothetical protein
VEIEEDMMAKLDTVNVGVRLQTPACRKEQKAVKKKKKSRKAQIRFALPFVISY